MDCQIELELAEATVAVSVADNPDAGQHLVGECSSACLLQTRLRTHGTNKARFAVHAEMHLVKCDVVCSREGECRVGHRARHRHSGWDASASSERRSLHRHSGWDARAAHGSGAALGSSRADVHLCAAACAATNYWARFRQRERVLPVHPVYREERQLRRVETVLLQETVVQCSVAIDGLDDAGELLSPGGRVDDDLVVVE
eukprot:scaffold12369_cov66-Phaeocystis_antarctica.AAC.5